MACISRTVAFLAMIAAPLQAYADDRNGYFPTDILAVGRSYATFATMHTSEHRHMTFRNVPGDYDKQLTIESATIRHGLFENVDLTLGMAYNSQYKSTQFYANGASATPLSLPLLPPTRM